MKLSLLEMQALEYACIKQGLHFKPWYKSELGLFSPTFFSVKDGQVLGTLQWDDGHSRIAEIYSENRPYLFGWLLESLDQPNRVWQPRELLQKITSYESDAEACLSPNQHYKLTTDLNTIQFRDGLVLTAAELAQLDYELVGLEQN
jgi:hypothetical protein